jgi:PTS system nitrogen regulatory IIA component
MQLKVTEIGKYLNVSEATVTRWIKQRGLPAQYVGGQYRCNRAELLEWATANGIKVSLQLFDLAANDEPLSQLSSALEAGGIFYNVSDTSKSRALAALVQVLPLPDDVDRELLFQLYLAREASATTAIGDGIALPHVRHPIVLHVASPLLTLCFLERPVDFGALDGKPVQILFSLICPTTRSYLQMLSRLSFALHDRQFKDAILRNASRDDILREVRRVEAGIGAADTREGAATHGID